MAHVWKEKNSHAFWLLLMCYIYGNAAYTVQECYTCPTGAMSVNIGCPVGAIQIEWVAVAAKPLSTGCANDSGISYDCSSRCCTLDTGTDCIKNDTSLMTFYGFCNGMANCSGLVVFDSVTCDEPSLYPAVSSLMLISYTCDYSDCGDPTPVNGQSDHTGTTFGHTATLSCDVGYTLSGHTFVTCKETGWSGSAQCTIKDCGDPTPANGTSNHTGTSYGHTATLSCGVGYTLSGNDVVTCTDNGWNGSAICLNTEKDCGELTVSHAASVTYPVGTSYGGVALVTCQQGYQLVGHSVAVCQLNGEWSAAPTCDVSSTECGEPSILGATLTGSVFTVGSIVGVSCNAGFYLQGAHNIACQADGSWTELPTCTLQDCGNLAVRYASVTYPVGKAYKGVALVTCLQGYQLIGHGVAICQNNGSWSETPTCEAVSPIADAQTSGEGDSNSNGIGAAGLVLAIIIPIAIVTGLVIFFCCYKKRIYSWLKEELDLLPTEHPEPTFIPPPVLRPNVNKSNSPLNAPLDPRLAGKTNASRLSTSMNDSCALKVTDESLDKKDVLEPKKKKRKKNKDKLREQRYENETYGIHIAVDSEQESGVKTASVDNLSSSSRMPAPPTEADNLSFTQNSDMNITRISRISDNKEETNLVENTTRVDAPINDDSPRSNTGSINQNSVSSRLSMKSPPSYLDRSPAATINGMETIVMPKSFRIQHTNDDDDDGMVMSKTSKLSHGSIKSFLSSRGSGSKYAVTTDGSEDGTFSGPFEFKSGLVIKRDK